MAKTILLVDDDPDLLEANGMVLRSKGYSVRTASSSDEARRLLESSPPPDLAVLDVMMETANAGFHLANDVHARFPDLPLVMLSGINEVGGLPYRFDADPDWLPVARFLEKPLDPNRLAAVVAELLGDDRPPKGAGSPFVRTR